MRQNEMTMADGVAAVTRFRECLDSLELRVDRPGGRYDEFVYTACWNTAVRRIRHELSLMLNENAVATPAMLEGLFEWVAGQIESAPPAPYETIVGGRGWEDGVRYCRDAFAGCFTQQKG